MTKQTEALKMAIEALEGIDECYWEHTVLQTCKEALAEAEKQEISEAEIRQMLKEIEWCHQELEKKEKQEPVDMRPAVYGAWKESAQEVKCNPHPDAPHGFMRDASHSQDRYVCECEYWEQPAQEPVACKVMAIDFDTEDGYTAFISLSNPIEIGTELYTHHAIWQSLSDDNILKLFKPKFECEIEDFELIDFSRAIEQALKEKNHG